MQGGRKAALLYGDSKRGIRGGKKVNTTKDKAIKHNMINAVRDDIRHVLPFSKSRVSTEYTMAAVRKKMEILIKSIIIPKAPV